MTTTALSQLPRLTTRTPVASQGLVLGADIGGTNQTVAVARLDGEVLALRRRRLRAGGTAADVVRNVLEMAGEALEEARRLPPPPSAERLVRVGVGFGGPVDLRRGVVLRSHHVPGWEHYPLCDELERALRAPVVLDNDANAGALGEARFGAGRGERHMLYVNVGTGIGGAVVLGGTVYHGAHAMAGEIGHVTIVPGGPLCGCGKRGCLEALASGCSLGRRALEAADAEPEAAQALVAAAGGKAADLEGPHVIEAARGGDALAIRLIEETAGFLGLALANAANVLDPGIIVIGGGISEAGDVFFGPLRRAFQAHLMPAIPPPNVVPAALGYNAGVVGALALALDGL